ncbi:hypothetical protein DFS34DRAFT_612884 [Phlyctochytrium arcticum]|nr:hypothetical protein DFS34DRAFT_612884 [Phlyctochytrium arcticum]
MSGNPGSLPDLLLQHHSLTTTSRDPSSTTYLTSLSGLCQKVIKESDLDVFTSEVGVQILHCLVGDLASSDVYVGYTAQKVLYAAFTSDSASENGKDFPEAYSQVIRSLSEYLVPAKVLTLSPHQCRQNATTHALNLLQRLFKYCRSRLQDGEPTRLLEVLADTLAMRGEVRGAAAWMGVLFRRGYQTSTKLVPLYIKLMTGVVKTYTLCSASANTNADTAGSNIAALVELEDMKEFVRRNLPTLGAMMEDSLPFVKRRIAELIYAVEVHGDMTSISLLLDPLFRTLKHLNTPSFTTWWHAMQSSDYTEFYVNPSITTDRETLKLVVYILLQGFLRCLGSFGKAEKAIERHKVMHFEEAFGTEFSVMLKSGGLRQYVLQLYGDNDAQLFKLLLMLQQIYVAFTKEEVLQRTFSHLSVPLITLNPHILWLTFCVHSHVDADMLLDFLISIDCDFLAYFSKYLHFCLARKEYCMNNYDKSGMRRSMGEMFRGLKEKIERLVDARLFPYSPGVLLIRLGNVCELIGDDPAEEEEDGDDE